MVSLMLDPSPDNRPPLYQILEMDCVVSRRHLIPEHLQAFGGGPVQGIVRNNLLDTIQVTPIDLARRHRTARIRTSRSTHLTSPLCFFLLALQVPRNLKLLKDRLPAPQYPDEHNDSTPSWENDPDSGKFTGGSVNGPTPERDQRVGGAVAAVEQAQRYGGQPARSRVTPRVGGDANSKGSVYSNQSLYGRAAHARGAAGGGYQGAYARSPNQQASGLPSIHDGRYGVQPVSRQPRGPMRGLGSAMPGGMSRASSQVSARPYDLISHRPRNY